MPTSAKPPEITDYLEPDFYYQAHDDAPEIPYIAKPTFDEIGLEEGLSKGTMTMSWSNIARLASTIRDCRQKNSLAEVQMREIDPRVRAQTDLMIFARNVPKIDETMLSLNGMHVILDSPDIERMPIIGQKSVGKEPSTAVRVMGLVVARFAPPKKK